MSISVDQVFVKQFEADVHLAYCHRTMIYIGTPHTTDTIYRTCDTD